MTKEQEMKATVELIELEITDDSVTDDASNNIDAEPESTRMSKATWLAAVALGMSLTTAIQQQASTASIVKHIDAALGKERKLILLLTCSTYVTYRSYNVLQLDYIWPQHYSCPYTPSGRRNIRHDWEKIFFYHWLHVLTYRSINCVRSNRYTNNDSRYGSEGVWFRMSTIIVCVSEMLTLKMFR
jgi:hypothetical protein